MSQTYENLEVIIVNDGSTDNSMKILKKFEGKVKIIHQENLGLASALNTGLKQMTGKWFKWFSPDDILDPNAITILVKKAQVLGGNYIVYSNWEIIDSKKNKLRNFAESNYNDLDKFNFNVRLLDGQQINVNTSLIPSWLFEKGCDFQDLEDPVLIDYDFFCRAGLLYDVGFYLISQILLKYRIHEEQLSHNKISISLSLKANDDVRAATRSPGIRVRSFMISSVIPSQKYSLSLSILRSTNGRTAINLIIFSFERGISAAPAACSRSTITSVIDR